MPGLVYTFRVALYTVTLLSVAFFAIFEAVVFNLIGQRLNTNYYVARTFYAVAGPIMGWQFEVEGEEHLWALTDVEDETVEGDARKGGRSAVLLGNHQSFVDILYLGRIFPKQAAIMAKKSIKLIPGLGWWMMLSGTVFINRSNNRSAIATMHHAGEEVKRKRISLWIFPEGTRHLSPVDDLLPFKKGAFYLAVQSNVPIIPVVCQNYHHLFDGKTRFKSGKLRIKVLPPIPTTGMTTADVPELMEKTRDLMVQALREISQSRPSRAESPTPLLADRSGTSYESTRDDGEESSAAEQPAGAVESQNVEAAASARNADIAAAVEADGKRNTSRRRSRDTSRKLNVAMVSDFFLPVVGGVEGHIYSLGVELMRRGHHVIVITHHHPPRTGVRYLAPGLKVYYLPFKPIASNATLPNFLLFLPYLRNILLRERIDLVHGHGSLSSLAHEAMFHAPLMGVKTVFTDHSLFGFGDAVGVLTNKLLVAALRNVDGAICVSHTGRENTVLRAQIEPELVSVIPNAVESEQFRPDPAEADPDHITIVIISRLVYRKGIDLLVAAAPQICELYPNVRFLVGGDGPKMVELEQMREKYQLQDRVTLLGSVKPSDVRSVLVRGQIYLNTSLTEAFGISIIEAAAAGLFVVATQVGGVPEILPDDMIEFARADDEDVVRALRHAIHVVRRGEYDPMVAHERVKGMYSWVDVAGRTEIVYERAMATPHRDTGERLARYLSLGPIFGPILCCIIAVEHSFFWFLEWWYPRQDIDYVDHPWCHDAFVKVVEDERAAAHAEKRQ